jgi:hypothetical protein
MSVQDGIPALVVEEDFSIGSMDLFMTWLRKDLAVSPDRVNQKEGRKIIIGLENQEQMSLIINECDRLNLLCSFSTEQS